MSDFSFLDISYPDYQESNYPSHPLYNPFARWVWQYGQSDSKHGQSDSISIREPNYSLWSQVKRACIRQRNDEFVRTPNLKQCKLYCEDESGFPCKSVEFNTKTYQCHLSKYTRRSAEEDYMEPCIFPNWEYSEMVEWDPPINACTKGAKSEAKWEGTVESVRVCLTKCRDADLFACRSVEFESTSRTCYLFNTQETSDRRRPCPLANTDWKCSVVKVWLPDA